MSGWWDDFIEQENRYRLDDLKRKIEELEIEIKELERQDSKIQVKYESVSYKPLPFGCPENCN
jgi:chaperonin cofactor prefoldin